MLVVVFFDVIIFDTHRTHLTMTPNPGGDLFRNASSADVIIATVAVSLRLLAGWKNKADFGADDLLIVVSLLPQYATITIGHLCMCAMISLKLGC